MAYVRNLQMFVRVYELRGMSAAARDQRTSPAVASSRISDLEKRLGVRLFNRTTRALQPTENGKTFYEGACKVLDAIADAEAAIASSSDDPKGTIFVAAPLGIGRRFIAPAVPEFKAKYPLIDIRLRMSDRTINVTAEGLDLAFHLGILEDSNLKVRVITECPRILCAAPEYIARRGNPADGDALVSDQHDCLSLRFPGSKEFRWSLVTDAGPEKFDVKGPYESDDGDVLTGWALDGHGIIMKPIFEIADYLRDGRLVPVAEKTPPIPVQLACLSSHRRLKDPKIKLFTDYMVTEIKSALEIAAISFPGK
ncbi:MAG: LysR substrate-binding domain-containing protein [Paracoccaceae bacterium]